MNIARCKFFGLAVAGGLAFNAAHSVQAQLNASSPNPMPGHAMPPAAATNSAAAKAFDTPKPLPPLSANLPAWMTEKPDNATPWRQYGNFDFSVYNMPKLSYDLNAIAVGHAMVYAALAGGQADRLETDVYTRIATVFKNPPLMMPSEWFMATAFSKKYPVAQRMFDWAHNLHTQNIDVLTSTQITNEQKDRMTAKGYEYYSTAIPAVFTPLPMNLQWLDSQPYSGTFRAKYPRVNALFWAYHWLQTSMFDMAYGKTNAEQRAAYDVMSRRYHETELYRADRPAMPLMAQNSPIYAAKFPEVANVSDNLHMAHDMVNDILATTWMTDTQKDEQIRRALYLVSADAHRTCKAGDYDPKNPLHDHRLRDASGAVVQSAPAQSDPKAAAPAKPAPKKPMPDMPGMKM